MITFDFETEAIVGNPVHRPPRPVGVSIKYGDAPSHYYAWGHPTENNCTWEEGRTALLNALRSDPEWLAHNSPFEAAVLRKWFGVNKKNPLLFHDTQYLVFLYDPYSPKLGLKPSAERILGIAPDEQTELMNWILRNVPGAKKSDWGAYICKAPGRLVGKYAIGDTDRTKALFDHCYPSICGQGMQVAYERELLLAPTLSESTIRGVRIDEERLQRDIEKYTAAKNIAERYIHKSLGEFNLDSDAELADALDRAGQITEWVLTPTGRRSTSRKNLMGKIKEPALLEYLAYRGILATCLGTFAQPWLEQASTNGGRVHPQWNQVRGDRGSGLSGTRTGRMSCNNPNLQNIPNDFEGVVVPPGLPSIICMRDYMLPEEGHIWLKRDFSAQEMRIMAHFAEGRLFEAFIKDPLTDPHTAVQQIIRDTTGIEMLRKYVKITGFGIMYGEGLDSMAERMGLTRNEASTLRNAYFQALPEVKALAAETRKIGGKGQAIRTWGGRRYHREQDPAGIKDFSYKLFNYLIQGSAADQTKQSMIDWERDKAPGHLLMAAVHDEINISVPVGDKAIAMEHLKASMDADRFDVPFRSEGFAGPSWGQIEGYDV